MKILALATALMVSTAALAQATPPADPAAPAAPAQPTDMTSPPAPEAMPAPVTDPATTPAPTAAAPAAYPRCSATVTDQCRQSSARESDYKGGPAKHRRKRG